jgi:hypothetical protein
MWSRNLEHEEAKARYRTVQIQPQWVVTPEKQTNKQIKIKYYKILYTDSNEMPFVDCRK